MTTEDLKQIGELLEPISKRLDNVEKNMATKSDLEAVREQMATKSDLEAVSGELETVRGQMATKEDLASLKQVIKEAIKQEAVTVADFFHDTWDKMETTNERVEKIEDHLGLRHPHNN